jgi:trehalose 6-phosphate synthase
MGIGDLLSRSTRRPERRSLARRAGRRLIVLANRAPFRHECVQGHLRRVRSASGVVTAIEPLLLASGGTWVAHGEAADTRAADANGHVRVEAGRAAYDVRFVEIPAEMYRGFYGGFANEALWPLCHTARVAPHFRSCDFAHYQTVNSRFAAAVAAEGAGGSPIVFVQDYHFALAPLAIRRALPSASIVSFWHIPWPGPRAFTACPWGLQLLRGLLGSDVIGLQTDDDCEQFLDTVALVTGRDVDRGAGLVYDGVRVTRVRSYPVGVPTQPDAVPAVPPPSACRDQVRQAYGIAADGYLMVGIDRMDYTKGLPEKFAAFERLLERRPELRHRVSLLQVAEPSRGTLDAYRSARARTLAVRDRVNARFGSGSHLPIVLLERHCEPAEVYQLYRAADVCYVNSLHDGMNLVAKEFVSARSDERGVLVLSKSAGASQQLGEALLVNPHDVERSASTLESALQMNVDDQRRRMRAMRRTVFSADSTWWANRLLEDALASSNAVAVAATAQPELDAHPLEWNVVV